PAHDPQREGDVLVRRHVVEQPEVLEHDADATPQRRDRVARQCRNVVTELSDKAARRLERQEQQPQQRGLAGAGWPGQELERVRFDAECEVPQDLRAQPIAQADVLKSDHPPLSDKFPKGRTNHDGDEARASPGGRSGASEPAFLQDYQEAAIARAEKMAKNPLLAGPSMVSDPLRDGWYVGHPNTIDPMLIACPNCSTSYMIDPASLGEAGRTVRCAKCKTTWFASKPEMVGAGSDDEPGSATGVIRPDHSLDDIAGQEEATKAAPHGEEAAPA